MDEEQNELNESQNHSRKCLTEYQPHRADIFNFQLDKYSQAYLYWTEFRYSPKELWILLICKMLESFAFASSTYVYIFFLDSQFKMTSFEAGIVYAVVSFLTFVYGIFFSGYLIDNTGDRVSLSVGTLHLFISLCLVVLISERT